MRCEPALWQQTATIRPCDGTIAWWPCTAGNCLVGRPYTDASGYLQAFVVSEFIRSEGRAIELSGSAALNSRENAGVWSQAAVPSSEVSRAAVHVEVEKFPCLVAGGRHHALDGPAAAKASHGEEELRELERMEPLLR